MQSDCNFIPASSASGMQETFRVAEPPLGKTFQPRHSACGVSGRFLLTGMLTLAFLTGCGGSTKEFQPYDRAQRAPAIGEQGPHQGHLVDIDNGAHYAEVVLDPTTHQLTLYVLQNDFLKLQPVPQNGVALDLVERRPLAVTLAPQPQPNDPPGQASRYVSAEPLPETIRTTADLSGLLKLTIDGKPHTSPLQRDDHQHDGPPHSHPPATASVSAVLPQLAVYCVLIVVASFGGGWLPSLMTLTHTRMQVLISLVGGLMLGIGLLHLLPHSVSETGSVDVAARWAMFGLLTMFFLIRTFHFHQHGVAEVPTIEFPSSLASEKQHDHDCGHDHDSGHAKTAGESTASAAAVSELPIVTLGGAPQVVKPATVPAARASQSSRHSHGHHHGHGHHHDHDHDHGGQPNALSWMGVAVGLGLHTAIDGMVLAASMQSDAAHLPKGSLLGLAPFAAIVLHKPLDAVSITSLMRASGWSATWRNLINAGFALMCPLGATLFLLGMAQFSGNTTGVLGAALGFSAGVFLCISLGDLLPELEFHSHHRVRLSVALLIGILAAWAIGLIEPAHLHSAAGHHH